MHAIPGKEAVFAFAGRIPVYYRSIAEFIGNFCDIPVNGSLPLPRNTRIHQQDPLVAAQRLQQRS